MKETLSKIDIPGGWYIFKTVKKLICQRYNNMSLNDCVRITIDLMKVNLRKVTLQSPLETIFLQRVISLGFGGKFKLFCEKD